jgi:hypothetical protein
MARVLLALALLSIGSAWARAPPGLERHPRPATVEHGKALHVKALAATQRAQRRAVGARSWVSSVSYAGTVHPVSISSASPVDALTSSSSSSLPSQLGRSVSSLTPSDFGGDPTGRADSTPAFQALCAQLFNATSRADKHMASKIVDFGGATLDLAGGEYLISAPVVVPLLVGNVRITGGTLRASPNFPSDRYLLEIGSADCVPADAQNVCNEYIVVHDIMLDAAHVAAGGVVVYSTMGTTIGPSAFFIGFNQAGVRVEGGHETIVSDAWLAEYYWSDHDKVNSSSHCSGGGSGNNSVGVSFNGEDNYMSNVIIFDFTCIGVLVNGAATTLDGVHSWNGGGIAILVNGSYDIQDRIVK